MTVNQRLTEEANKNPVANAVFHVFAMRQRARAVVTLHSLYNKMKKEGFTYPKYEYVPVLKLLAELKFGDLDVDARGKVKGLKNVTTTLQSIGEAAVGQKATLKSFKVRNRFRKMPEVLKDKVYQEVKPVKVEAVKKAATLEVIINDKPIKILLDKSMTSQEMAEIVTKLIS